MVALLFDPCRGIWSLVPGGFSKATGHPHWSASLLLSLLSYVGDYVSIALSLSLSRQHGRSDLEAMLPMSECLQKQSNVTQQERTSSSSIRCGDVDRFCEIRQNDFEARFNSMLAMLA